MKVLGYIRVSTDKQDLERQRDLIRRYCIDKELIGIEEDFAVSGAKLSRVGLNNVLTNYSKVNVVVVSELSRISRNEDVMETFNLLYEILSKFNLVMLDDPSKVYKKNMGLTDFLMLAIKAYGAADERKKITERMLTGKVSIVTRYPLAYVGAQVPLGFKVVSTKSIPKSVLEVDEEKIQIVKKIYQLVVEGSSLRQATKKINMMYNLNMSVPAVRFVLKNPFYNGRRLYKGTYYDTGIKVIDDITFNKIGKVLQHNREDKRNDVKFLNPLKGILKCTCGHNLGVVYYDGEPYYGCANHTSVRYKAATILDMVWRDVKYRIDTQLFLDDTNASIKRLEDENSQIEVSAKEIEMQILNKDKERDSLLNSMTDFTNVNLLKVIDQQANNIDAEISKLNKRLEEMRDQQMDNIHKIETERKALVTKIVETPEGKKSLYQKLLDKVNIFRSTKRSSVVKIHYKNGTISTLFYLDSHRPIIYSLPSGFEWDADTCTISTKSSPRKAGLNEGRYKLPEVRQIPLKDIKKLFVIEDWEI